MRSLQPGISFSPTGEPSFNVQIGDIQSADKQVLREEYRGEIAYLCTALPQCAIHFIIKTQAYSYEETLFRLPEKQKTVLIALAKNGATKGITSGAFIRQYRLTSASAVQAAVKGLLEKDFITCEKGVYSVYDLFMAEWLRREH